MSKKKLTARTLSLVLLGGLFVLAIGSVAGFYFTQNILREYAVSTNALTSKAAAGSENVAALTKIREYLLSNTAQAEKVKKVVAESKSYNYRDDAVKELTKFAGESGVSIVSINFAAGSSGQGSAPAGGAQQPQAPAAATPPSPGAAPDAATGQPAAVALKSSTFSVAIKNPVNYEKLLSFVSKIEQNVTKMQISQISLTVGEDPGTISSENFNIEVYLR